MQWASVGARKGTGQQHILEAALIDFKRTLLEPFHTGFNGWSSTIGQLVLKLSDLGWGCTENELTKLQTEMKLSLIHI